MRERENEIILTEKNFLVSETYFVICDTVYMLNLAAEWTTI